MLKTKTPKIFVSALLMVVLLMAVANLAVPTVKAQVKDEVTVDTSIGGTTDPAGGASYSYTDGTTQTFTATAGTGFYFESWTISTAVSSYTDTDNPLSLTLNQTDSPYEVQPIFAPIVSEPLPAFSYKSNY